MVGWQDYYRIAHQHHRIYQSILDHILIHIYLNPFSLHIAALMALKKKKQYMDQIEKIMGTRQNMETQVMAIESANFNLTILDSMKSGAQALGAIQSKM